jgi:hypothetical protein
MDKANKLNYFKWSLGDRYDGWRLRKVDALFSVSSFLQPKRVESEVFFEINIPIDKIENFVREQKENIPGVSIMHVVMASLVRLISQRPHVNRFVVWNKLFARNHVSFSLAIKRSMTDEGEETVIKPYFLPTDTLADVVEKVRLEVEKNKKEGEENSSDSISKVMNLLPDFLLRTVIFFVLQLDKIGILPKMMFDASPFHTTLFLTNSGSIGIEPIYHHLYELGTCSMFVSMGKKERNSSTEKDGKVKQTKSMKLKFVLDERICDGFYYATTIRMIDKILNDPDQLLKPPHSVVVDSGVGKKRADL